MKRLNQFKRQLFLIIPLILIGVGIILNGYVAKRLINDQPPVSSPSPNPSPSVSSSSTITSSNSSPSPSLPQPLPSTTIEADPVPTSLPTISAIKPKYGHFPYSEGNPKQMMIIASYAQGEYQRFEKLAPEAALALMQLIYAARDDGVWIVPVSGFRTIEAQEKLFARQTQRRGSPEAAAKISAPPKHSEHHTGYAIDLTDGNLPKADITDQFAETEGFKWLTVNAQKFGFELSFPENNAQGISYEPWHWRFVGSPTAKKIFKQSMLLQK